MFPFFFFQTEATKESDMSRYIHAPKEDAAARWNEVRTRFLPLTVDIDAVDNRAFLEPLLLDVDAEPLHSAWYHDSVFDGNYADSNGKLYHFNSLLPFYGRYDVAATLDGSMIDVCLDVVGVADCSPCVLAYPRWIGAPHHVNHYKDAPTPYVHDSPFLSKGLSR